MNPPIEKSIASLRSTDFHTMRQAQLAILSVGKPALPLLLEQVRSSDNQQQVALSMGLVGDLDAATYAKTLLECAAPGKLCFLLRYPNREAIRALSNEQRQELQNHLSKCAQAGTADEKACLEKVLQAITEK